MAIYGYNQPSLQTSEVFEWLQNKIIEHETNITMTEGNISDSEVFNRMSELTGNDQKEKAIWLIKNAEHLQQSDIEVLYMQLKMMQDGLTASAVRAFDEGKVVLLYNEMQNRSMTQAIPYLTFNTKAGYISYIFTDRHMTKNREGVLNMRADVLRDMMMAANLARGLKTKHADLSGSQFMTSVMMQIYTEMFIRVINREYSIYSDRSLTEHLTYYVNRFFLSRIVAAVDSADNLHLLSHKNFKALDEMSIEEARREYDQLDPQGVTGVFELIKNKCSRCQTLELGIFINKWIDMYYMPSMLAIDNIEYLFFMILSMISGNNIISRGACAIVRDNKNIKALRAEFTKFS